MPRSPSIPHKLRALAGAGLERQSLVLEAAARMLAARIAIRVRPFGAVSRGFGEFVAPGDVRVAQHADGATAEQARTARRIGWAVRAAAPYMPFRSVCLQQAMAAHAMLRRRGIRSAMHFGAGKGSGDKPIDAHAWLDAAGMRVTGYPIAPNLVEIGCFV